MNHFIITLLFISVLSVSPLTARGERESHAGNHEHRNLNASELSHHPEANRNLNAVHPNSALRNPNLNHPNYPTGVNYGNYGGGVGGVAVPYPYPNGYSQPGMGDDSNAIYQSQLNKGGQGY